MLLGGRTDSLAKVDDASPDIESSTEDYAARFAGPVGRFLLDVQSSTILELLDRCDGRRILEVGGGHAQLVEPLTRAGYQVTVLGSHASCQRRLKRLSVTCEFRKGSILELPFEDRCFDAVIGVRLFAHVRSWRKLLQEFCRVSRHSVVLDYADRRSANALKPWLFPLKKALEGNTRLYQCHEISEITESLAEYGYALTDVRKQFFLPMALHRTVNCVAFSRGFERLAKCAGATRRWGSPVVALAQLRF